MRYAIALSILLLAVPAAAQTAAQTTTEKSPPVVDYPTGEGDPEAVTCRKPQPQPNSRLPGPKVCKTNAVWAQYRKDGMDVSADGRLDVPSEKSRSLNASSCQMVGGGSINNIGSARYVCN